MRSTLTRPRNSPTSLRRITGSPALKPSFRASSAAIRISCRPAGVNAASHKHGDFPLVACLAGPRAGDLGAVDDAPLGTGLRPAAALLVARARRQQDNQVSRLDEHRRTGNDVLVDAQTDPAERPA